MTAEPAAAPVESLTFTGVDSSTDPDTLLRLWRLYPATEFGVLIGGSNRARHQTPANVDRWRRFSVRTGVPMAVHLCGPYSARVNDHDDTRDVQAVCAGFGRVQINARFYNYDRVAAFADTVICDAVIVQQRETPISGPLLTHPKVQYLFDRSGGRGRRSFDAWPPPTSPNVRAGYAGGISPASIGAALAAVQQFGPASVWLDMETGVRTDDRFDVDLAETVCAAVFAAVGAQPAQSAAGRVIRPAADTDA